MREIAETVLRRLAGAGARLRDDQWRAIEALVAGRRRVLLVQRTGFGKSAVYFVATALLRGLGGVPAAGGSDGVPAVGGPGGGVPAVGGPPAGPTVIVSPLLALMRNQVEAAAPAGIRAATINSANVTEWDEINAAVAAGEVDVLLVSPERLNNPDFRDNVLPALADTCGLLVIDEAHCVSDWGHDFRPDYRRIRTFLAALRPGVPVLATTATANARVTADVAEQLRPTDAGVAASDDGGTLVLRGPLDRDSLRLGVLELPSAAHRLAWLSAYLDKLPGSGIVYTLTVAATEEVAGYLRSRGHTVASYSGRTDAAERAAAEADLLANRVKALVATSALGMGFDKPDLGFVVHLGAPASPIAYYQQVGRAGRAVDHADVVLLPGPEDAAIWRYFASLAFPPEDQVSQVLKVLGDSTDRDGAARPMSTQALEARVDLRRGRLELMLKVLDVDGAVRRVRGGWVATGARWDYDAARYERVAQARQVEQEAMRAYVTTPGCRLEFLRRQLDDPYAEPCGRCDRCAGPFAEPDVPADELAAATEYLGRAGVEIEPRKMWPSGAETLGLPRGGRIAPGDLPEVGRALGRLSDIGWGNRLRDLLRSGAPDTPVPEDVFRAMIDVLAHWDWVERPRGIVSLPSRTRPELVGSLARRLAQVGRLPYLGELARTGGGPPRGAGTTNGTQRLAAVYGAFAVPAGLLPPGEPVLLVDDLVDTGWTVTVAARALRAAGAGRVLPLALALDG